MKQVSIVQSKIPKIGWLKGKHQIEALICFERGALVTAIICMSTGGTFLPPLLIFLQVNWSDQLMKVLLLDHGVCNPSNWVQM